MTFKDYLGQLNQLALEKPELLECEVVYSSGDEGNYFQSVHNDPIEGYFFEDSFIPEEVFDEAAEDYEEGELVINSICIN